MMQPSAAVMGGRLTRDHRRLAAIVSADVVGYSLLMGRDDSATLAGLKAHRRELIDPKIAEYSGRIVKTTGDGLLLEFPSVVDAVRCAVDVQRGMAERNAGVPSAQRIDLRIGINVGDIIIDGDDIFGDGVNVAARLQTLAEPGGICVSRVVRDQVLDKLSFTFEDLGPQDVKNIARPVEAYRVDLGSGALQTPSRNRRRWRRLTRALGRQRFAAGVLALGLVGIAVWALPQFWKTVPASTPPAFSVAVLSFATPDGTQADQQFAHQVTQQITNTLGHTMHYATIVPHQLGATETAASIDARALGRKHNVRYLIEGDVRNEGDSVKVNAKLIDADNSTQLWSDQFDVLRSQWVADPGGASWPVSGQLRRALWAAERRRVAHDAVTSGGPMDLLVRGTLVDDGSLKGALEARKFYDEALRLDPGFTAALISRAYISWNLSKLDPRADRLQLAQEMNDLARRAVASDRTDANAWLVQAWALQMQGRSDAALEATAEATRIQPHSFWPMHTRAWILSMTGRADEAVVLLDRAIELEPQAALSSDFRHNQCYALLLLGQFDKAIVPCEKSVAVGDDWWPHMFLTAAYGQTGDMAKAAASKAELLRRRPGFSIAQFKAMGLSDNPVFLKQNETNFIPGLRKAGIPEQ
jgi:adenylate cyclase